MLHVFHFVRGLGWNAQKQDDNFGYLSCISLPTHFCVLAHVTILVSNVTIYYQTYLLAIAIDV